MAQLGVLVTIAFGISGLVVVAIASLAGYWWVVVISVALVCVVPPVFYDPRRARPIGFHGEPLLEERRLLAYSKAQATLRSRLSARPVEERSATPASPELKHWARPYTPELADIEGLIGGSLAGGALVAVSALAGPAIGGIVLLATLLVAGLAYCLRAR
jgi:hypothetical protein